MTKAMSICAYHQCSRKFTKKRAWHKYCSTTCRVMDWHDKKTRSDVEARLKKVEDKLGI